MLLSNDNSILLLTRVFLIQVPVYPQNMSCRIEKLSKRYGNQWALRDVSFDFNNGEILGVFGPAESGKTTLLRIIAGMEKPNGGAVSNEYSGGSGKIMFVSELPALSFWDRARSGTFELNELARRSDQAFNDAINGSDRLLLLDDPFRFLDPFEREKKWESLRTNVKEKDLTAIVATSDFREVMAVCDRVIVLADGRMLQEGIPSDVYIQPVSSAVARLTGRNNLIEARRLSSSKADQPEFHTIIGEHRLYAQKSDLSALGAINRNVTLAIRPEHVSISFGASFPADNLLKATIVDVRFRGPFTLVKLDSSGLQICALVLRLVGLEIGDECMVGLPPERIIVLKD